MRRTPSASHPRNLFTRPLLVICLTFLGFGARGQSETGSPPATANATSGGYSLTPLREPQLTLRDVMAESDKLHAWLSANYGKLQPPQFIPPREQLYFLIGEYAKLKAGQNALSLPSQPDPLLTNLFAWSERLGVFGGHLLYNRVKPPAAPQMPRMLTPKGDLVVALNGDLLNVSSQVGGWSLQVPYYFMIWTAADFPANNGLRTQITVASTGTARHSSGGGRSQSTIMFIHSPAGDPSRFTQTWRENLLLTGETEVVPLDIRGLSSTRGARKDGVRVEWVNWTSSKGPFAVIYSGVPGPYEWNREHFLDFMRTLDAT